MYKRERRREERGRGEVERVVQMELQEATKKVGPDATPANECTGETESRREGKREGES